MRQSWWLALLLISACKSEDRRLLDGWVGIYKVQRATDNPDGCDVEGPDMEVAPNFFELDAEPGIESHLVELRECVSATECSASGFVTGITRVANATRLESTWSEKLFSLTGGDAPACIVQHQVLDITRDRADSLDIHVELRLTAAEEIGLLSDESCVGFLEAVAKDDDACTNYLVFEARLVE
jgi:hypothetical protein